MSEHFRREPIRSKKLRNAARGQACVLNFPGICTYDAETTVLAHLHDETFGKGIKADDTSAVHSCHACHEALDQHRHGLDEASLYKTLLRGLQRTIRRLAIGGIIVVPQDPAPKPRRTKTRKHKAGRAPIQSRNEWPQGRKIQSRPFDDHPSNLSLKEKWK